MLPDLDAQEELRRRLTDPRRSRVSLVDVVWTAILELEASVRLSAAQRLAALMSERDGQALLDRARTLTQTSRADEIPDPDWQLLVSNLLTTLGARAATRGSESRPESEWMPWDVPARKS